MAGTGRAAARQTGKKSGARSPGRPTREEGVKLREQLLNVATKEFLKRGYAAATIDGIAARSKIGKMTIYRHFPSKERLFRAVVLRVTERFQNDLAHVKQEGRDVRDVITDFAMASYDDPASEEMLGITRIIIAEATNFPDLAYTLYAQRRELLQPITGYLRRMVDEGVLQMSGDPELAAFQLVALASGGIRALMIPREAIERDREMWTKAAVDVFLNGTLNQGLRAATKKT